MLYMVLIISCYYWYSIHYHCDFFFFWLLICFYIAWVNYLNVSMCNLISILVTEFWNSLRPPPPLKKDKISRGFISYIFYLFIIFYICTMLSQCYPFYVSFPPMENNIANKCILIRSPGYQSLSTRQQEF